MEGLSWDQYLCFKQCLWPAYMITLLLRVQIECLMISKWCCSQVNCTGNVQVMSLGDTGVKAEYELATISSEHGKCLSLLTGCYISFPCPTILLFLLGQVFSLKRYIFRSSHLSYFSFHQNCTSYWISLYLKNTARVSCDQEIHHSPLHRCWGGRAKVLRKMWGAEVYIFFRLFYGQNFLFAQNLYSCQSAFHKNKILVPVSFLIGTSNISYFVYWKRETLSL